jgi:hypothetical protein
MTRGRFDRATLFLLVCLELGCATTKLAGSASTSIEEARLSVGDRHYQLDSCSSGDLEYFLGVDLADQKGGALVRLVIDPIDGPRLAFVFRDDGAGQRLVLGRDRCSQLEAAVRYTGWEINTVRDFSGFVDAECRSDEGQAIGLHVRFSHCH